MLSIILWIFTSFLWSTWDSFRKLAIEQSKMTSTLFSLTASLFSWVIILLLFLYFGVTPWLFQNYTIIGFVFIIILTNSLNGLMLIDIYKNEKLSSLMPYSSLDKVFVVVLGFIVYFWTENETSFITLCITLLAIAVIFFSTTSLKNISFSHSIKLFVLNRFIKAATILSTWYILLTYSWIDFVVLEWIFGIIISLAIVLILKQNPWEIIHQNKLFYKNRLLATILWWWWYILGLYIIQSSGVVIATLLWFFTIVFNVISMKYIVKDNPTKKQILLAVTVLMMIWIGYYFK